MRPPTCKKIEDYSDAIRFLYDRINYERASEQAYTKKHFKLARMSRLLDELGNPQRASPVIHIAGTKGKGSVAWLVSETLRRTGFATGLYTSPHLLRLEDRFVFDGASCSPQELLECARIIAPAVERVAAQGMGTCTFFELTTAIGWLYFRMKKSDIAVVEVGLGGRLDSTNVCNPILTIITSISYDHQQQLGNTLPEIAREKAGIIKPHIPLIHGAKDPQAARVIESIAKEQDCDVLSLERDFSVQWQPAVPATEGGVIQFRSHVSEPARNEPPRTYHLKLLGRHQSENAAIAIAAVDQLQCLGWKVPDSALQSALAHTQVRARLEIVQSNPWVLLDTAHNTASFQAMIQTINDHFGRTRRVAIFSSSRDKDYRAILKMLVENFDVIVLTQFLSNPRATEIEELQSHAQHWVDSNISSHPVTLHAVPDPVSAWQLATQIARPSDLICICGSFFLAAELLPSLGLADGPMGRFEKQA